MNWKSDVSDASRVLIALCSPFALTPAEIQSQLQPLKLSQWNHLARELERSQIKNPAALSALSAAEMVREFSLNSDEAEQIRRLLDRIPNLVPALEELEDLWVTTRLDSSYPAKVSATLQDKAPPVLFGAGPLALLGQASVAVVGSRNINRAGTEYAATAGRKAVECQLAVVSGGARGTDRIAMNAALQAGGASIGALADSLSATMRKPDIRELVEEGRLALVTPYAPDAGFSVGGAMGRNKLIYGLADFALVVSSDFQTGGTWAGALEALKANWCPVFVREGAEMPPGNRELLKLGGVSLSESDLGAIDNLQEWLRRRARPRAVEQDLF